MASTKPQVNRAITEAINKRQPRDGTLTDAQKVDRERATTEYLTRLSEGEREMRTLLRDERYHG